MKYKWKKCLAVLFVGCLLMGEMESYTVMAQEAETLQEETQMNAEEVEQIVPEDVNEENSVQTTEEVADAEELQPEAETEAEEPEVKQELAQQEESEAEESTAQPSAEQKEKKETEKQTLEKKVTKSSGNLKAAGNWEQEDNNSYSTANPILPNTVYYGVADGRRSSWPTSILDYYKVTLPNDGVVSLTLNHPLQDYDSRNVGIGIEDMDTTYVSVESGGFDTSVTSSKVGLPKGTYYIYVYGEEGVQYNFKLNYTASAVWEKERNNKYSTANPISPNTIYYGVADGSSMSTSILDYYKVTLPSDGVVSLTLNHPLQDYDSRNVGIGIEDTDTTYVSVGSGGFDTSVTSSKVGLPKGTYYIYVYGEEGLEYNFKVNYTPTSTYEKEYNNAFSTANPIALDTKYTANLGDTSDKDYFTFTLKDKTWVNLYFMHKVFTDCSSSSAYSVGLYNSSGKQVTRDEYGYSVGTLESYATSKYDTWGAIQLKPGKYYLVVQGDYSGLVGKEYQFTLNKVSLTKPKITSAKATSYNRVKIKWQQVKGVEQYYIYRGTSKKNMSCYAYVYNPTVTSYTDTSVECGKKYYYQVEARVLTTGAKYKKSDLASVRPTLTQPQIAAKAKGKKQIKVSWKKVKGASGYEIYGSTSAKGKYKKIKTIKSGSTCSFTNKKLKSKKTYYYKVRAYRTVKNKKVYSSRSKAVAQKSR